ncbi:MAG: hypothetical protein II381_12800, partial [Victivallales bacterium]|nr:hypothetical protein [Victivallales bacterium]
GVNKISWTDPDDIEIDDTPVATWFKTILVRKEGSYPSSPGDGTTVATTSASDETKNAYASTFFRDTVPDLTKTYYYKLYSYTTDGSVSDLADNEVPTATVLTPTTIHQLSQDGTLLNYLDVGDCILVNHPDFDPSPGYTGQLVRFMGYDCVTPTVASGFSHAAVFQFEDCLYSAQNSYGSMMFDPAESQYALTADETFQTGKTYYTKSGSTYTATTEDTDWTAGDSVTADTYYEKNPNPNYNYGCNKWVDSNLRQYLNADAAGDAWWEAKNIWDAGSYKSRPGFLYNFPIKSLLVPITKTVAIATPYGGGSTTCEDKIFLPSMLEVFNTKVNNISEGSKRWDYYTANASDANSRIKLLNGEASIWWLSSPIASSGFSVYSTATSGSGSYNGAYYTRGVAPAFAL